MLYTLTTLLMENEEMKDLLADFLDEPRMIATDDEIADHQKLLERAGDILSRGSILDDISMAYELAKVREVLDGITTTAELLIKEGSVDGPMSLQGWCKKAREILTNP